MPDKPDKPEPEPAAQGQPLSRVALGVAAGLAVALVIGVIVVSLVLGDGDDTGTDTGNDTGGSATQPTRTGPLALVAVDAPDAESPACAALVAALPDTLPNKGGELARLPLAEPAPRGAAAWAGDRGEPVVLRCGLGKPAELQPTAQLRTISSVDWLPVAGAGATTWYTVGRTVYVAVTVPADAGTGPIQELSEIVTKALPAT